MARENIFQDGPHLLAALLCERVLEEKDGVKSLIRVIDRIVTRAGGVDVPETMPPVSISLTLFLVIKAGKEGSGKHQLKVKLVHPASTQPTEMIQGVNIDKAEERGIEVKMLLNLNLKLEGLYWFEVYFDDWFMTRVPLSVLYLTQKQGKEPVPQITQ